MTTAPSGTSDVLGNNKLQPGDRAFHDWYRFVLSFPPHLVRHYMEKFSLGSEDVILDPFCGTGTTLVEAKKNGIAAVGIEALPMSHLACRTKTQWTVDTGELRRAVERVLTAACQPMGAGPLLTFTPEQAAIIVKNSICEQPLHDCLVLQGAIAAEPTGPVQDVLNLALAYVAVYEASNLKFGPEVGIRRNKRQDVAVLDGWQAKVAQMTADLAEHSHHSAIKTRCYRGDARQQRQLAPQAISAVITSPPYPNEKDYTRTTRLESVLLGFLKNKADLRALKQSLIRSNTRNVYKVDDDDRVLASQSSIIQLAQTIEDRRIALDKTSGFERLYHRVVGLYFGGMKQHLLALRPALKPGARLAYVVGDQASFFRILIRTGELLAEIAHEAGYTVVSIDLFRTRLATATRVQLREEVVVLEWPGL